MRWQTFWLGKRVSTAIDNGDEKWQWESVITLQYCVRKVIEFLCYSEFDHIQFIEWNNSIYIVRIRARPAKMDSAGWSSWALKSIRWWLISDTWEDANWLCIWFKATQSCMRMVTIGSLSIWRIGQIWPDLLRIETWLVLWLLKWSSDKDVLGKELGWEVLCTLLILDCKVRCYHSIYESLRFRARTVRYSGWSVTNIPTIGVYVEPFMETPF